MECDGFREESRSELRPQSREEGRVDEKGLEGIASSRIPELADKKKMHTGVTNGQDCTSFDGLNSRGKLLHRPFELTFPSTTTLSALTNSADSSKNA